MARVSIASFQTPVRGVPRLRRISGSIVAAAAAFAVLLGPPAAVDADLGDFDVCNAPCGSTGPFPYVNAREVYLRYAPGSSAFDYATGSDTGNNLSYPGYIEISPHVSSFTGTGTYTCVALHRSSASRSYSSAWVAARCLCCGPSTNCENYLEPVIEHSLGGTLAFPPTGDCFDQRVTRSGHFDHRPKQKPCKVTNPNGARLFVAPNGHANPVLAVKPFEFTPTPVVVPYGHHAGWETGPGGEFVTRHAVNGYRWVTNIYKRNRHPTRRGWVKVDDLDCRASAKQAGLRQAEFVTIGVYDLPTSIDTGALEHLIDHHGLRANLEVYSPQDFANLSADDLNSVDVWLIGSSEEAAPPAYPCSTGSSPCVSPGDYDGLRSNAAFQGGALVGRRMITGQDPDDHALRPEHSPHTLSTRLLLDAIHWVALYPATGVIVLADTVSHLDWTPGSWGVGGTLQSLDGRTVVPDAAHLSHPLNYRIPSEGFVFGGAQHAFFAADVAGYDTISRSGSSAPVTIASPAGNPPPPSTTTTTSTTTTLPASCPVTADAFDDDLIDAANWRGFQYGVGPAADEVNQRLEITLPSGSGNGADEGFGAGYITRCALTGDFDVQVAFTLLDWPAGNGVRLGIGASPVDDGSFQSFSGTSVSRTSNPCFRDEGREVYLFDAHPGICGGEVSTGDAAGTLRLVRQADTMTGYYFSAGSWVPLASAVVDRGPLRIVLSAWSDEYFFTGRQTTVAFDDFRVN